MSKAVSNCALCTRKVYVNNFNLCKRCNIKPESTSIKRKAQEQDVLQKQIEEEAKKKEQARMQEMQAAEPEEAKEETAKQPEEKAAEPEESKDESKAEPEKPEEAKE